MKDKWMNMGYEEDELKPFIEPTLDITDEKRIDLLVRSQKSLIVKLVQLCFQNYKNVTYQFKYEL